MKVLTSRTLVRLSVSVIVESKRARSIVAEVQRAVREAATADDPLALWSVEAGPAETFSGQDENTERVPSIGLSLEDLGVGGES